MDKARMKYIEDYYSGQDGLKYPCSNQVVRNIIFVYSFDDYVKTYMLKNKFQLVRTPNSNLGLYKDHEGNLWEMIKANPSCKGKRCYRAIIDQRIDEKVIEQVIMPMLYNYCCGVKFI